MRRLLIPTVAVIGLAFVASGCGGGAAPEGGAAAGADPANPGATPVANNPAAPATGAAPAAGGAVGPDGQPIADAGDTGTGPALPDPDAGSEVPGGSLDAAGSGGSDVFEAKAQLSEDPTAPSAASTTGDGSTTTGGTGQGTQKVTVTYGPATISLDGQTYTVDKGGTFPKTTQQFKLTQLSADSVVVTLNAGEFSNGSDGITLAKGKTVSLVNQSEGITYVLKLVSVKANVGGAASTGGAYMGQGNGNGLGFGY